MPNQIKTSNLAEALFHIRQGHRLVDVKFSRTGVYETTELLLKMEGQGIVFDRRHFCPMEKDGWRICSSFWRGSKRLC